jgi:hypothetical protein
MKTMITYFELFHPNNCPANYDQVWGTIWVLDELVSSTIAAFNNTGFLATEVIK